MAKTSYVFNFKKTTWQQIQQIQLHKHYFTATDIPSKDSEHIVVKVEYSEWKEFKDILDILYTAGQASVSMPENVIRNNY